MRDRSSKRDKKREIAMAHATCVVEGTLATPRERGFEKFPCPESARCTANACCALPITGASTPSPDTQDSKDNLKI